MLSTLFSFLKTILIILSHFVCIQIFKIIFLGSVINTSSTLIGISVTLEIILSGTVILTIIIPLLHVQSIFSHLLVSSLIFSTLSFFEYRCFTSLGRFISRYFIFSGAHVNGIICLISTSRSLLLV